VTKFTVSYRLNDRADKRTGLTFKRAKGLVKDLAAWQAEDITLQIEPNLVWTALTSEERRERAKFWQGVIAAVCFGVLAAVLFWGAVIGASRAWCGWRFPLGMVETSK